MSDRRRFTVAKRRLPDPRKGRITGWCVFDRGRRITIAFSSYREALERRDNIHKLYLRFGW
jgi:hypothetical protein